MVCKAKQQPYNFENLSYDKGELAYSVYHSQPLRSFAMFVTHCAMSKLVKEVVKWGRHLLLTSPSEAAAYSL